MQIADDTHDESYRVVWYYSRKCYPVPDGNDDSDPSGSSPAAAAAAVTPARRRNAESVH